MSDKQKRHNQPTPTTHSHLKFGRILLLAGSNLLCKVGARFLQRFLEFLIAIGAVRFHSFHTGLQNQQLFFQIGCVGLHTVAKFL